MGKTSQNETDGVIYRKSPMARIAFSQMGGACTGIVCILMTYVSYLANAGYGIAVALAGVLITCTSVFDGITDPIVANIVDNVNTKFGKIRICMATGWGLLALVQYLMFYTMANHNLGPVVFFILYCLYIVAYTLFDITNRIIPPVLTNDPKQRPVVGVWNTILTYFAPMATMLYFTIVLLPKYNNEYSVSMLRECCSFSIIASGICLLICLIAVSPVDKPENFEGLSAASSEKVTVKDMIGMLKSNKALQTYMWAVTSDRIAVLTAGQSVVTTMMAGILMKNMSMATVVGLAVSILSMSFCVVGAKYTGKHGSRKAMTTWTIASMATTAVLFVFYLVVDLSKVYVVMPLLIVYCILSFAQSSAKMACSTTVSSMMSDIVDYQLYETGKYMPAAVTATYSFLDKIVTAFGSTIALGLVALIGYTDTMPQPTDAATTPIFVVTMLITIAMPMIGWVITLIAMKKSPLTREKMIEVQKGIADQKKEM